MVGGEGGGSGIRSVRDGVGKAGRREGRDKG